MDNVKFVINAMEESGIEVEEVSPNFVAHYAYNELGLELTASEVVKISDTYGEPITYNEEE